MLSIDVPAEVLEQISSYLCPPEDQRCTNKGNFIAVSRTCKKLCDAVLRDLFRDMTLKFTYTYDMDEGRWMVPKLVELIGRGSKLKPYVQAMRFVGCSNR
jgi:hypothetical protein